MPECGARVLGAMGTKVRSSLPRLLRLRAVIRGYVL